ncbi:OmpW family outer membrane protein [Glaciecola sp. 2405UD65-10]|jgi:outer membrane protein|uniref:OmpW family outer membrane protein n=1 Tax=Glaciecola sp. 2405UD65-10 TaxID=3397244 RepID=UPI003B5998A9
MKKSIITLAVLATLSSAGAFAADAGDMILRAGLTTVAPDETSSNVTLDGAATGLFLNVDNNTQLGLNFAYFLTDNINIEVLAATPFTHDMGIDGVGPLGSTKHLPPTVTANYYFADASSAFQPYAGVGLNYTIFFDEEFTAANKEAGFSDLDADASFGLSAQVGFDYNIDKEWLVNASVRYIDISTDASFKLNGADGAVTLDIDPWVYTVSVGYKF